MRVFAFVLLTDAAELAVSTGTFLAKLTRGILSTEGLGKADNWWLRSIFRRRPTDKQLPQYLEHQASYKAGKQLMCS